MNWLPDISTDEIQLVVILIAGISFFYMYWFVTESEKLKIYFNRKYTPYKASINHVFFIKLFGFLSMGVFSFFVATLLFENPFQALGFTIYKSHVSFLLKAVFITSCLTIPVGIFASRNKKQQAVYPQIRVVEWKISTFIVSLLGWAIYLLGYEILFRGLLLQPLSDILGFWTAVTLNTAIYSVVHLPKGPGETIGSIPLGFVLAVLCLKAETFWVGFFIHLMMSWTNNIFSFINNPEMTFKR